VDRHFGIIPSRATLGQTWRRVLGVALVLLVVAASVLAAVIVLSSDTASQDTTIGRTTELLVTLMIPAVVMIAYWFIIQRQVRTAKADLESRVESGEDLIARVSHQLRDQLTVIYGFSEALLDSDMNDETELRDVVSIINAEAVDLGRIVDDLVAASELDKGEFAVSLATFDPAVEVERVVVPFRRRGHEISVDCWSGAAVSDPIRFRQIVRTLLSNATQHGGETVGFVAEVSNGSFLCTVVDDGDGMSSSLENQLFGSPTDPALPVPLEISGLGLSVSHAIVHQLGGRLTYERSNDLTMVTMVLPTKDWPEMARSDDEDDPSPESADTNEPDHEDEESQAAEENTADTPHDDEDATDTNWTISFKDEEEHGPDEDAETVEEVPASSS
jgi:signal transduction histidine kinase